MERVATVGLDIAKPVFQVHGIDATGLAGAPRVRAFGRDRIRAKGIMASATCESRMQGRTHGRTNQPIAAAAKTLANGEPSAHDQDQPFRFAPYSVEELGSVVADGTRPRDHVAVTELAIHV
jgi:hypothetical protein